MLTYATGISGHNLKERSKEVLSRSQRYFALAIVRTYRTEPNLGTSFPLSLIPIHFQVIYEAVYDTVSTLRRTVNIHGTTIYHTEYVKNQHLAKPPSKINIIQDRTQRKIHSHIHWCINIGIRCYGLGFRIVQKRAKMKIWSEPLEKSTTYFKPNYWSY